MKYFLKIEGCVVVEYVIHSKGVAKLNTENTKYAVVGKPEINHYKKTKTMHRNGNY